MGAHVGRDVLVEFAIAAEDALPGALVWQVLGMMRGKSVKANWDTADTTADKSPAYTKTQLVTFKQVEISGDGVAYDDAVHNQDEFRQNAISPVSGQPKAWLRLTYPNNAKYEGPFIVNEFSDESPYDGASTWNMNAMSNGNVVYTPGA